jgi:hypothetical protein
VGQCSEGMGGVQALMESAPFSWPNTQAGSTPAIGVASAFSLVRERSGHLHIRLWLPEAMRRRPHRMSVSS